MMTMEAWLAELEMEENPIPSSINSYYEQRETMEGTLTQQLSSTFSEDFLYLHSTDSNASSFDQWDLDDIIVQQIPSPSHIISNNNNNNTNNINVHEEMKEEVNKKQGTKGGAKRKRQPNQVQDHIMAERRRRELLSQMFISLSALVPGLKKIDKTSILGEAISYMTKLQENVKALEEAVAKRTVESIVCVRKPQSIVNNDNGNSNDISSTMVDNRISSTSGGGGCDSDRSTDSFPEIEARISDKTLLLKVFIENKKGVLIKLFQELDKHDFSVCNCSVVPFGSLALDITIVAQVQKGFNINTEIFVRKLRSAFRLSSY